MVANCLPTFSLYLNFVINKNATFVLIKSSLWPNFILYFVLYGHDSRDDLIPSDETSFLYSSSIISYHDGRPRLGHKAHFCCRKMVTQLSQNLWWPDPWWWDNLFKLSINSSFLVFSQKVAFSKNFLRALTIPLFCRNHWHWQEWFKQELEKRLLPQHSDSEAEATNSPKSVRGQNQNKPMI